MAAVIYTHMLLTVKLFLPRSLIAVKGFEEKIYRETFGSQNGAVLVAWSKTEIAIVFGA